MIFLPPVLQTPAPPMSPPPRPFSLLALGDALELSAEQRSAITSLVKAHAESLHSRHGAVREALEAHHQGLNNPALGDAEVEALFQQAIQAQRAEFQEARALLLEATRLLRADQLKAYQRLRTTLPRRPQGPPPPRGDSEGRHGDQGLPPKPQF